jgi:endonuclease YncB( thermonuclease family)
MAGYQLGLLAWLIAITGLAGSALADPCHAKLPHQGDTFEGRVTYVGDGDSLCVGKVRGGVEVRLTDFNAPELSEREGAAAKAALDHIARGREVTCLAEHRSYDRIVAVCRLDGVSIGELMRRAGINEGGR